MSRLKKPLLVAASFAAAACMFVAHAFFGALPAARAATPPAGSPIHTLPGMPPVLDPHNIYSADGPNMLCPAVKNFPSLVYVPNSKSDTVDIIDPATYKIIRHFALPKNPRYPHHLLEPQHVVPSWDLKKLWVAQDLGDQLTEIDPATGREGKTIHVDDPYNMYFTPDGKYAIVMAERERRLDFRDSQTRQVEAEFAFRHDDGVLAIGSEVHVVGIIHVNGLPFPAGSRIDLGQLITQILRHP